MHARENHAAAYGCKETRDFSRTDFRSYLFAPTWLRGALVFAKGFIPAALTSL